MPSVWSGDEHGSCSRGARANYLPGMHGARDGRPSRATSITRPRCRELLTARLELDIRAGCPAPRARGACWHPSQPTATILPGPVSTVAPGLDASEQGHPARLDDRGQGFIVRFVKSLTPQRERPFRGGRNGVIQINAAARLPPKEFAQ
jgi:hypothetical protein